MKIEIEPKDVESIVHKLIDLLKPFMSPLQREENGRTEGAGQNQRVLMDVQDVAEYLGVKISWVYDKTRRKEIPHAKVGKHLRFRKSAIDDWLTQKKTALSFDKVGSRLREMDRKTRK
jgi:excisionase family DNA binding protein